MTPERWARIKEVLAIALGQPEKQREAFLKDACGSDQELRQQIDTLLAAEPDSSLKSPVAEVLAGQATDTHLARGLATGQMLGHYRIDSKLGEGGMGVVYKARDTHLDRFVAIKVLPPERVADPDRKRRFILEAKAASALNHPNIITIHDIAHEDGIDFIVMEHVPGKTLNQVIPRKGLRLDGTLKYAVEIAGALAAAHAAGIVHRDIKPTNIMVTDRGRVKVLDFGLAKLTERTSSGEDETGEGTILGTVTYMSPEQAQGKPVDARSDIFSFGSVLYEMVAGRRAFPGSTPVAAMSAILNQEPAALGAGIPRDLDKLIRHCLRKDPERRFQHMDDVRSLLEELKEESESRQLAAKPPLTRRPRRKLIWAAAVLGIIGIAGAMFWLLRPRPPAAQLKVVPLTTYPGHESFPSFSPDGSQLAFSWDGEKQDNYDIYVKLIGTDKPVRLTKGPAGDFFPAWSPDGRHIAFVRRWDAARRSIFLMSALGGSERRLAEPETPQLTLAWSPDGQWLVFRDRAPSEKSIGLFALSPETGEKRQLTHPPARSRGDGGPAFSPDGRTLAFSRMLTSGVSDLYLLPISPASAPIGEPRRLTFEDTWISSSTWTSDGRQIIFASGSWEGGVSSLWRKPVVGSTTPHRLEFATDGDNFPAISHQGLLAFARTSSDPNIWSVELSGPGGRAGPPKSFLASTRMERNPKISPDGKRIAFVSNRGGSMEIWVCEKDGSNSMQLTSMHAPITGSPRWSPDGKRIVFDSNRGGQFELYLISTDGGAPQRLTNNPQDDAVGSWSRDGRWIYFASNRTGQYQVWKMPANGGEAVQVTKHGGWVAFESPDGKLVCYSKTGAELSPLMKVPVQGGDETQLLEAVTFMNFEVVKEGIYFIPGPDQQGRHSIQFLSFATGKTWPILFLNATQLGGLAASPDGATLLYAQLDQAGSDLMLVENFR